MDDRAPIPALRRSLFGLRGDVLDARVAALLDLAGLTGIGTRIGGFSRGMKQRLGVALTAVLLGVGPAPETLAAVALWFVYAIVMLSAMVLLSAVLPAPAAAAGAGLGVYAAFAVLAQFEATSRITPAGLMPAAQAVLNGEPAHWQAPVATSIAVSAACLAATVWRFSRREI